jgi:hypothetical protein
MLDFDSDWRFDSPSSIPEIVIEHFLGFIVRCGGPEQQQNLFEHFKDYFATAAGATSSRSSSASWAETDLRSYMCQEGANAALFIEAFYDAFQSLPSGKARPGVEIINRVLRDAKSGWEIRLPNLVHLDVATEPIRVHEETPGIDKRSRELIQNSLSKSEKYLAEGEDRQAVAEILWLLETVSTVFQGIDIGSGTVEGKYFNKIVGDLRRHQKGTLLERVLEWMMSLHGYLSSLTGGGVRHGRDISGDTEEIGPEAARLFCNLIRSYILFLLAEHNRLRRQGGR